MTQQHLLPVEPSDQDIMSASVLSKPSGSPLRRGTKTDQLAAMLDRYPLERQLFESHPEAYREWLKAANHLAVQRVIIANARVALHSPTPEARAIAEQTLSLYEGADYLVLATAAAAMRRTLVEADS